MGQKRCVYIPEGSTPLQEKFVNYVMKRGKKTVARKVFADMLEELKKKGGKDPEQIFERAIENVKPAMEVRPKRIGGAVYQIPIEVKPGRQTMLAFRWILEASRAKKGMKMANKLAGELMDAANQQGSAIKKKEDSHKMAQANKAFAHFAKY
ncbi:MAG: 30S ribosomal protein S7 [Candidatus Gracilibacteria bacterium]|jgi:small subunit ribosomal protein S7